MVMSALRSVLGLAMLGLVSSVAQFHGSSHHASVHRPSTHYVAARPSSSYGAPRVVTAATNYQQPQVYRVSSPSTHTAAQNFNSGAQNFHSGAQNTHSGAQNTHSGARNFQSGAQNFNSGAQNFHNGAQNTHSGAQNFQTGAQTFNTGGQNFNSGAQGFRSTAPSSHSGSQNFRSSAPSFHSSAPSTRTSAQTFPSSAQTFPSSAQTFSTSAPHLQSSAPSSHSNTQGPRNTASSFQASAPSSHSGGAQSFRGSSPSFQSSAPSSPSSPSGSGSSASSSGPKFVGRQRLAPTTAGRQSFDSRKQLRQTVRAVIQGSTKYYVSWASGSHRTYTWDEADHECRRYGLRLVSLTSFEKEAEISKLLNNAPFPVAYYWTSATKQGPNGGFMWADRDTTPVCEIDSPRDVCHENWGRVGQLRQPQPDNAEGHENCLAVLNRFYPGDGITWHDIACHHKKHFVCERY